MEVTDYQSSLDNLISSIFIREFKLVVKKLIKKIPELMASLVNSIKQLRIEYKELLRLSGKETNNPI